MFYVNNGMKNTHFVRFAQYVHMQILHGDSDKPPSFSPVTALYDKVFVAGQAGIDRYAQNGVHIPLEKFEIVGRPQVETIIQDRRRIAEKPGPVVLYAPTWRGNYADSDFCSLPIGAEIVTALLQRDAVVIFRPHPFSRNNAESSEQIETIDHLLAADRELTGREHRWGADATFDLSIVDCFNLSDAMVTDVSSVASDYLHSQKPFAVSDMLVDEADFVEIFPLAAASYVIRSDCSNIEPVLDQMLGVDSLAHAREDMHSYYLGDFPVDRYADAFIGAVRTLVRAAEPEVSPHLTPEND